MDFGTPVENAQPRGRAKDAAEGLPRSETGRAHGPGDRTHGVGSYVAGPGSGSGGDVDPDVIGIDDGTGLAQDGLDDEDEIGEAETSGGSEEFASGPPAEGRNQLPRGTHGGGGRPRGDTVDHSGEDVSTVQRGSAAAPSGMGARGGFRDDTADEDEGDEDEGDEDETVEASLDLAEDDEDASDEDEEADDEDEDEDDQRADAGIRNAGESSRATEDERDDEDDDDDEPFRG
jgi:hypothetical protein